LIQTWNERISKQTLIDKNGNTIWN
jgi:hypothetical protein